MLRAVNEHTSLAAMFLWRTRTSPDRVAYQYPSGDGWASLTWKQTGDKTRHIACGLRALGLQSENRCAILSGTRIEWILADLGIMAAGGATTTVYPSNTADECAFILKDSNAVFVFAEDATQVKKLQDKRAELPLLKAIIVLDGQPSPDGTVLTLDALIEQGRAHDAANPGRYEEIIAAVKPTSLATLIYTSGTTGQPKGVELTHDVWLYEASAIQQLNLLSDTDTQYLWLPLAHVFGKVLEAMQILIGFPTAVDGRVDKIVDNLAVVKPTMVAAVPRIFEKVFNKARAGAKEGGALKSAIFNWAFEVAKKVSRARQDGKSPGLVLGVQHALLDKLVYTKLRARFGGRIRLFISGSAPLSKDIGEFFHGAGLLVLEGYGLTESGAASFVNRPESVRYGTVGPPLPGTELKIEPDGEILIRGRGVMRGYHGMPEATAEAKDADAWLHTGDIGELDSQGRLKITDRKKELIKTSGGKYIAPTALEGRFKVLCPYASQMLVHGDKRNYCTALIAMDEESIRAWANENDITGSYEELSKDARVIDLFQGHVDQLNAELPSYSTIKKFTLLPRDLSEARGELTPSQKLKRKAVQEHYLDLLDAMYPRS